ncbi:MAG: DUF1499 domain-containing protein [Planctomycetaceae bacterium]
MRVRVLFWSLGIIVAGIVVAIVVLMILALWSRRAQAPRSAPLSNRLPDCPATPNCVCSQATREAQFIRPFDFRGDADSSLQKMLDVLEDNPAAQVVTREKRYLHVEFRSPTFGFTDDVEFLIDDTARVIQVRSASRIGYSDRGANRRRIENLRELYEAAP